MEVLAASRSARPPQGRIRPVQLDLRDPASLGQALQEVEAVVHCAYADRATTVDGTRNLVAAMRRAGVGRLVHLSSISVYGEASGEVTESRPRIPGSGDDYGGWKAAAEEICEAAPEIAIVMLRPTIVHGAGSGLWVSKMARRLEAGAIGDMGAAGEGTCNLVHVRDVAEAAAAGLTGRPGAYNISGTEPITWNDYFARLAGAIGVPLPGISPAALRVRALAAFPVKVVARLLPPLRGALPAALLETPLAPEQKIYALRATYPVALAAEGLGWAPRIGIEEGLADGAAWWLQSR